MFEAFMFINPIGTRCYQVEQNIMQTMKEAGVEASYHIVPIVNIKGIQRDLRRRHLSTSDVELFNRATKASYDALNQYHAIKLTAGNKKARSYIYELQEALNIKGVTFDDSLFNKIIADIGLSSKTIIEATQSKYLEESICEDQKLAKKYNVQFTPTTVVFNDLDDQSGVLIEGSISSEDLLNLVSPIQEPTINIPFLDNQTNLHLI